MSNIGEIEEDDILEIYTDGACRNNPGKGAGAFLFVLNGEIIKQESIYFGHVTNNQAEYKALINALEKAIEFKKYKIKVFSDSQLLVNQMNGIYKVGTPRIMILHLEAYEKAKGFENIEYLQVPRNNEYIKIADKLCSDCLRENFGSEV